jgi:uncharacterized protein (TIGR04255 family)
MDFLSPVAQIDTALHPKLGETILKYFKIKEPKPAFKQEFLIHSKINETPQLKTEKTAFTEWNFFGGNREKQLKITPEFFFITYNKYEKYETLRDEFSEISKIYFENYSDAVPNRLGLRYINQIEIKENNPFDWTKYINQNLLGLISLKYPNSDPTRIFHNYEMLCDNNYKLRFQYGIYNPDYPAVIKQKTFILDYDAYFEGPISSAEVNQYIDTYHNKIQELFEQNITPELRAKMNES